MARTCTYFQFYMYMYNNVQGPGTILEYSGTKVQPEVVPWPFIITNVFKNSINRPINFNYN